jgi:hypothetical protein
MLNMQSDKPIISRRQFLEQSARGAGFLAAGVAAWRLSTGGAARAAEKSANPFAYDVAQFSRTDPKLIRYEQASRFACPSSSPRRISIGLDDRVYIAARSGVSVLGPDGAPLKDIATSGPARCVTVARDGTVYAGLRQQVEVFDSAGRQLATWEAPGKKSWISGLAATENEVFAADSGSRVVLRYDRSGKLAGRIGEKNKDRNIPGLIVPSPYLDVALGQDGLLRVNNPGRHCIDVYTTNGDLELSWGKPSAGIEGFCGCCNPVGLDLLPDGRCITSEKGLPRVKLYSADGTFECVVAGTESFPENARAGSARDAADGTMGGLDAAVDSQGRIYILDLVAGDVQVMKRKAG